MQKITSIDLVIEIVDDFVSAAKMNLFRQKGNSFGCENRGERSFPDEEVETYSEHINQFLKFEYFHFLYLVHSLGDIQSQSLPCEKTHENLFVHILLPSIQIYHFHQIVKNRHLCLDVAPLFLTDAAHYPNHFSRRTLSRCEENEKVVYEVWLTVLFSTYCLSLNIFLPLSMNSHLPGSFINLHIGRQSQHFLLAILKNVSRVAQRIIVSKDSRGGMMWIAQWRRGNWQKVRVLKRVRYSLGDNCVGVAVEEKIKIHACCTAHV